MVGGNEARQNSTERTDCRLANLPSRVGSSPLKQNIGFSVAPAAFRELDLILANGQLVCARRDTECAGFGGGALC